MVVQEEEQGEETKQEEHWGKLHGGRSQSRPVSLERRHLQLLLDLECWMSHCRVMSEEERGRGERDREREYSSSSSGGSTHRLQSNVVSISFSLG